MKRLLFIFSLVLLSLGAYAQVVTEGRFKVGDDPAWSRPLFDDSSWDVISLSTNWDYQGYKVPDGFGWYRIHMVIPSSLRKESAYGDRIILDMGFVDDCDEAYLNGVKIGASGSIPPEEYRSQWNTRRRYEVPSRIVNFDRDNVLAVRAYDGGAPGGFYDTGIRALPTTLRDILEIKLAGDGEDGVVATVRSSLPVKGTLTGEVFLFEDGKTQPLDKKDLRLRGGVPVDVRIAHGGRGHKLFRFTFTDTKTGQKVEAEFIPKYILTPPAPLSPRYNGPDVFGVRPGSPVIFRLPFSGKRPMKFSVRNLPEGVILDEDKGILHGSVSKAGDYTMTLVAQNGEGKTEHEFTLKVGAKIALTPPMGWNSWNCWGLSVSQKKVMSSALAIIEKGLADYGYSYINVDDAWEAESRNPDGTIATNDKFPDMKALGDFLHSEGLKLGIYSSPGDRTCGGYLGTLDHEKQDAETWNSWGVDYLKYDWCGYSKVFGASDDHSVAAYARPYMKMQQYLREQPRDIFYSLCQYGMADVWTWGPMVDANSWRTTGDITDTWQSLYEIGFERQTELHPYAGPGHWNDPDMLIVGKVGWSSSLRDSRLTADEQYTHISLWALLAANMLIGCDVAQMDDFTLNLLCNNEVNAVHQDVLGKQAHRDFSIGDVQVWSRPLSDGGTAVGIFNLSDEIGEVDIADCIDRLGLDGGVRDLWRQEDLGGDALNCHIAPHGVRLLRVTPKPFLPVMSYNIRYGTANDGLNSWDRRRKASSEMIMEQRPAVFGVQEALDYQLEQVVADCPGYKYVGVGREDGKHEGEHMAVFYDTGRVDLEKWGTYWLSETPDVPSKGWDAACRRTATWVLLRDKECGQHFYFVNTHLDHVGVEARTKGLAIVVERIGGMNPEGYPMILCGDFNVYPDDPCLKDLRAMMKDARDEAKSSDYGLTWHGWGAVRGRQPIDFIFYKGFASCSKFYRVDGRYDGRDFVSDHYPVRADLEY